MDRAKRPPRPLCERTHRVPADGRVPVLPLTPPGQTKIWQKRETRFRAYRLGAPSGATGAKPKGARANCLPQYLSKRTRAVLGWGDTPIPALTPWGRAEIRRNLGARFRAPGSGAPLGATGPKREGAQALCLPLQVLLRTRVVLGGGSPPILTQTPPGWAKFWEKPRAHFCTLGSGATPAHIYGDMAQGQLQRTFMVPRGDAGPISVWTPSGQTGIWRKINTTVF